MRLEREREGDYSEIGCLIITGVPGKIQKELSIKVK